MVAATAILLVPYTFLYRTLGTPTWHCLNYRHNSVTRNGSRESHTAFQLSAFRIRLRYPQHIKLPLDFFYPDSSNRVQPDWL